MKVRRKTLTLTVIFAACIILSVFTLAADSTYDSSKDPIVAQSYVDAKVKALNDTINAQASEIEALTSENSALKSDLDTLKTENDALKSDVDSLKSELDEMRNMLTKFNSDFEYVAVKLTRGQRLCAELGSVEVILRTGTAVVSSQNDQAASDMTTGFEVEPGTAIIVNHNILVPKDDECSIEVTSSSAWVLVRGKYEIK